MFLHFSIHIVCCLVIPMSRICQQKAINQVYLRLHVPGLYHYTCAKNNNQKIVNKFMTDQPLSTSECV